MEYQAPSRTATNRAAAVEKKLKKNVRVGNKNQTSPSPSSSSATIIK
jgi:hypothetical protein